MMTDDAGTWTRRIRRARAVLFDFDGTLAPNLDLPDLRRQVARHAVAHGVPERVFRDHYIVEILDAGARWLAARDAAGAEALLAEGHRLIREFEIDAARRTEPFPASRDVLRRLRTDGKSLAVVTRNCRDAVLAVFPDLADYCHLLARDDVVHLKPDERHLEQALEDVASRAGDAVMVGDGRLDMRIGKALGLYCVGVLSGSHDGATLREAGADVVLAGVADLAPALAGG